MKQFLFWCVGIIAKIHDKIMNLNNNYAINLTDKQMHFLVIGLLGMMMLFVVYPLFKHLAKKNKELVIAWIYVFTVIIVISFAIEIGQKVTNTGAMEFTDIMFGIVGFLAMFAVFVVLRMIYHGILRLIRFCMKEQAKKQRNRQPEE